MNKEEIIFHFSIMTMLMVVVGILGYEMVFISEAYLKALGV
jgi:hypothetical protein